MKKLKKLMALAAVSMLGIQMLGVGTALAADVDGDCDFGSDDLEITLGYAEKGKDPGDEDVEVWIDVNGMLVCEDKTGEEALPAASVESVTVEMDDDDSNGSLYIYLDDRDKGTASPTEWPEFDTFDIDVTTTVYFDGDALGTGARNSVRVIAGAKTISFSGTTATYSASALDVSTGDGNDTIDASKATVKLTADAGDGTNSIKGGPKGDDLTGGANIDVIYGNGGNDDIDCGTAATSGDQGWGGEGLDDIKDCRTAAPGAGDDTVTTAVIVAYSDLTGGIEYSDGETGGAAGYDSLPTDLERLVGSQGDDVIFDSLQDLWYVSAGAGDDIVKVSEEDAGEGATVYGGAGNDLIVALDFEYDTDLTTPTATTAADVFYGNAGDDVLKGKGSNDFLSGGPGRDQAWGGGGKDTCGAEVTNRCEYIKRNSV